jgi:hypothetical protein
MMLTRILSHFTRFPNIAAILPGDTAPSRNLLPAHGGTYSQLLADRANAQAAEAARKRLWAATCAVIAYEVKQ